MVGENDKKLRGVFHVGGVNLRKELLSYLPVVAEKVLSNYPIVFAYVFGSLVNENGEYFLPGISDIDIAFYVDERANVNTDTKYGSAKPSIAINLSKQGVKLKKVKPKCSLALEYVLDNLAQINGEIAYEVGYDKIDTVVINLLPEHHPALMADIFSYGKLIFCINKEILYDVIEQSYKKFEDYRIFREKMLRLEYGRDK